MCDFGRGYYEDQLCEIILTLGQWFRRTLRLKDFLSGALAALLFSGAEPFMQFMGNTHVKLYENLDQWFRKRFHLKTFLI